MTMWHVAINLDVVLGALSNPSNDSVVLLRSLHLALDEPTGAGGRVPPSA